MKQHGAWLDDMMGHGLIVAHGPVMNPAGSCGAAIRQLEDNQDIAVVTMQDSITQMGIGHYEHFPMLPLKASG